MKIFSDMEQTKTKFVIHTSNVEKINACLNDDDKVDNGDLSFSVLSTSSQPLFCRANTHEELSIWVASLLVAVGKGKFCFPIETSCIFVHKINFVILLL